MMNIGSIGTGFLRLGKNSVYLIGRMCALIDAHSTALENLDTDDVDAKYASDGSWILPAGVGGDELPPALVENHLLVATKIPATETVVEHLAWRDGVLRALPDEEE